MKKAITMILILAMVFSLVACGNSSSSGNAATPPASADTGKDVSSSGDKDQEPTVISLSMAHIWNSDTMYEEVFKEYFAYLERELDGKYKFDVTYYANNTLLSTADVYQGIVDGVVQFGAFPCVNTMDIMPVQSFTQNPTILNVNNASETARIVMEFIEYFGIDESEFVETEFISYFGTPNLCLYTNTPVYTPDDVKNMDLRCPGTWATTITDFGAVPVTMPMSEIVESAQKGMIKGAIATFIDYNSDLNLSQVYNCMSRVGFLAGQAMSVAMNQAFYDSLPDDVKQVVDDSHWYLAALGSAIWDYLADQAIEAAIADGCTVVLDYTDEQLAAWLEATEGESEYYIAELAKSGIDNAQEMYDKLQEISEKYVGLDYTPYEPGVEFVPNYDSPIE